MTCEICGNAIDQCPFCDGTHDPQCATCFHHEEDKS